MKPALASWERVAWPGLLIVAAISRFAGLGHRAMSHDESLHAVYSWYLSNGLNYQHDPMMHGPLLFHLNGFLLAFLPANDFVSRVVPALLGVGCVALLFLYRRWLGKAGAWCAAALVCLEPALLFYSRYLRNDITIAFLTLLMVWAILRYREERQPRHLLWLACGLAFSFVTKENGFIHGAVLGLGCVGFALAKAIQGREHILETWWTHPLMECALLMLTLALPFAGPVIPATAQALAEKLPAAHDYLHPLLEWDPLDNRSRPGQSRIGFLALLLFGASAAAGMIHFHFRRRLRTWGLCLLLFWTVQAVLYTTLFTNLRHGMASGVAGSLGYWLAQHEVNRGNEDIFFYVTLLLLYSPVLIVGGLTALYRIRRLPIVFIFWWTLGNLAVYSWAGERMPWLVTHIALPLCLLTGALLPRIFASEHPRLRTRALQTLFALGILQMIANSLRLAGPNAEGATEPMVYAHTGPELKTAVHLVRLHLETHPETRIQASGDFSWPLAWYFRDLPAGFTTPNPGELSPDTSVILVQPHRRGEFMATGWVPRIEVDMTTWPRPHYHRVTRKNLRNLATKNAVRAKFLRYYLFREQPPRRPGEWPGPSRFLVMTRGGESH